MNIERLYSQYQAAATEAARLTMVGVMEAHTEALCDYLAHAYTTLAPRGVAYCLAIISRKEKWRVTLSAFAEGNSQLVEWLYRADSKTRKNLYIWLGSCPTLLGAAMLERAAKEEDTYYVVPSLMLAIGKSGGRGETLTSLLGRLPQDDIPPKIWAEIEDAYRKAADRLSDKVKPTAVSLHGQHLFLLTTAPHLHGVLREEIGEMLPILKEVEEGLIVRSSDVGGVYVFRCFYEALLFDPALYGVEREALVPALIGSLRALDLAAMHGCDCVRYRVSAHTRGDKRALVSQVVEGLRPLDQLINSPSNYQVEVIVEGEGPYRCFVKLCAVEDHRYDYRKEALPASINPTTAAIIARLAKRYVKEPASILDCFCGTSTMLVEASKVYPAAHLAGVDIAKEAVDKSAVNCAEAEVKVSLQQIDVLRYRPKAPAALLLSNMPYGNRVGTHESNTRLYKGLVEKLPALAGGGFALLLTTEIALLKDLVMRAPALRLVRMYTLPAGGLTPALFVLKVSAQ